MGENRVNSHSSISAALVLSITITLPNVPISARSNADGTVRIELQSETMLLIESYPVRIPGLVLERIGGNFFAGRDETRVRLHPGDWIVLDLVNRKGNVSVTRIKKAFAAIKEKPITRISLKMVCSRVNRFLKSLQFPERIFQKSGKIGIRLENILDESE